MFLWLGELINERTPTTKNMIELVQMFEWKLAVILVKICYRKAYCVLFFIWYVIRQLVKMDSKDNNKHIRFVNIQSVKQK